MTMRSIACCATLLLSMISCRSTGEPGPKKSEPMAQAAYVLNAAQGKKVELVGPPNSMYSGGGAASLVDGKMGSEDHLDLEWLGWWYEDKDFVATVDLGRATEIRDIGVHVLTNSEAWIFYPRKVDFGVSADGKSYQKLASVSPTESDLLNEEAEVKTLRARGLTASARFLRVRAKRFGALPDWHAGHGGADGYEGQAWLFLDEILVNEMVVDG